MTIERTGGKDPAAVPHRATRAAAATPAAEPAHLAHDGARLSPAARDNTAVAHDPLLSYPVGEAGVGGHATEAEHHSAIDDLAHKVHNPHGLMHAVEAGEEGLHVAARVVGRSSRAAAVAAEVTHEAGTAHHGLLARAEHLVERVFGGIGKLLGAGIARIPGGGRFLAGVQRTLGWPGRVLGPSIDATLQGTRWGKTLAFTGSGARMTATVGGRLPLIGALLGGVIAVADVRSAWKTIADPHASGGQKVVAGSQGLLSAASGGFGLAAVGAAALGALGVITAPAWIPAALGISALLGAGAFVLTFFKKSAPAH